MCDFDTLAAVLWYAALALLIVIVFMFAWAATDFALFVWKMTRHFRTKK